MNPAVVSLIALLVAIVLSMTSRINVGLLCIAFAWLIGVYVADLKPDVVMGGFPVSLFLTLAGVTLLFSVADTNGTLERLAHRAVRLARGRAAALPILFFVIAFTISAVGPGAISSVALVVPMAMAIGTRAGVPNLLTALMVANGANAGNLSPIASVGVIANSAMAKAGVGGHEWKVWTASLVAHAVVSLAAYFLFGGGRLREGGREGRLDAHEGGREGRLDAQKGARRDGLQDDAGGVDTVAVASPPLSGLQRLTLLVVVAWIAGVIALRLNLGLSAFAAATLLLIAGAADERLAIKQVPWGVIMMVSGVSLLIALLEKTGGMDLFTTLLARLATPDTVNGVIAFVTGAISTYSSTSGVVLPAFLPTVSAIVEKIGGGDPLAVALSIIVGSALVDVSPLSTLGALCVAAVADQAASRDLFKRLLAWGLSMTIVGALLCQLLAGVLARA
ncbi:MAG: SLC13 family permease [Gemmatimonadaceae bacterium]|nr:SLC13 family permease [Gemmatimonadaceae bacterium]